MEVWGLGVKTGGGGGSGRPSILMMGYSGMSGASALRCRAQESALEPQNRGAR